MTKQKSSAQIHVADGAGGMRPITDLRFEDGEWPIELVIPAKDAQTWMFHLAAEIDERGWTSSAFSQIDAAENSGTLSVHGSTGPSPPTLNIIWEKVRGEDLRLRARPDGEPPMPLDQSRDFISAINARQRLGKTIRAHRRVLLTYEGLPWRGELWLDRDHRLGPPSKYPESLLGPQIVIVDAMVEGIGQNGVNANFGKRVQELRVFLSIVVGINPDVGKLQYGWVSDANREGRFIDCSIQTVGYVEMLPIAGFPVVGEARPIERRPAARPGLGPYGITSDMHEQWVPDDIEQLWNSFRQLPESKQQNVLRAGNAYLIARSMWPEQRTAYAAFLVVACEALKPPGGRFDSMNVYDVVASLLGPTHAENLRKLSFPPQRVRSKHVHRGELAAGEFFPMLMHDHFLDPSFDEMLRTLSMISRLCLIEWLQRRGQYTVVRLPRDKNTSVMRRMANGLKLIKTKLAALIAGD